MVARYSGSNVEDPEVVAREGVSRVTEKKKKRIRVCRNNPVIQMGGTSGLHRMTATVGHFTMLDVEPKARGTQAETETDRQRQRQRQRRRGLQRVPQSVFISNFRLPSDKARLDPLELVSANC